MEFRKIYFAENEQGKPFSIDALPIKNTNKFYCRSCGNPLLLCTTHSQGRFFLHDLEHSDTDDLLQCQHYIAPVSEKRPTATSIFPVTDMPCALQPKNYTCVVCDYPYHGKKDCPRCGVGIYTTEVEKRDMPIEHMTPESAEKEFDGSIDAEPQQALQIWLQACQRWLDDHARLAIRHGLSRKEVRAFHQLCLTSATLPERHHTFIIAPRFLLHAGGMADTASGISHDPCLDTLYLPESLQSVNPLHPLTDILLSESKRLKLYAFSHALRQLVQSCLEPGVTELLTLICWYNLLDGSSLDDLPQLTNKSSSSIEDYIHHWKKNHPVLFTHIEDYVFFACFSNWLAYR
ncbi:putative zinc ribbon protein [Pectobacterium versatile]|uniref:putative zinc ribbon protein n=1 Tax=Pectobacterium versatile TaxID=2488639 RepID=UPI000DE797DF|nr:putative zinc ribbon protein [Pectobacterium versatile]PVY74283.1 putative zinc ribbon protein [Pectobacterium versatile]